MPFFVTRRIIEGLGLGLACRAARKLVPVVLTLGSGPSGFPRKLSRRRLKLPRQPGRGASLALASVILALGAVGLPEKTFRATAEASATAMANPRRRSRALRSSGAGGWPAEAGQPQWPFCQASEGRVARARFRNFGAGRKSCRNGRFIKASLLRKLLIKLLL